MILSGTLCDITSVVLTIKWRTFYFITRITKRTLRELNAVFFTNSDIKFVSSYFVTVHLT